MIGLSIVGVILVLALGYAAEWYRQRMKVMIAYSAFQERWIDEILTALGNRNDSEVDSLVAEKGAHESPLV